MSLSSLPDFIMLFFVGVHSRKFPAIFIYCRRSEQKISLAEREGVESLIYAPLVPRDAFPSQLVASSEADKPTKRTIKKRMPPPLPRTKIFISDR